jgi:molybdate transport system substrate-binding protein
MPTKPILHRRQWLYCAGAALAAGTTCSFAANPPSTAPERVLTVGVASSLSDVVRSLASFIEKRRPGLRVRVISGASDAVATQMLTGGSDFDIVIFADDQPMARMVFKNKVLRPAVKVMATNQIVLISRHKISDLSQLTDDKFKFIGLADPQTAPLGRFGRQALVMGEVWQAIEPKIVFAPSAKLSFEYFQRGGVDAAVIYRSDTLLKAAKGMHIIPLRGKVEYQIAPIVGTKYPEDTQAFIDLALSDTTRAALKELAFGLP